MRISDWSSDVYSSYFGNLNYYLTPKLDVTVGARYAHNRTTFISFERGLLGNPDDPATDYISDAEPSEDSVVSYLADLRWRPSDNHMHYARAASGYHPAGQRFLPLGLTPQTGCPHKSGLEPLWPAKLGTRTPT